MISGNEQSSAWYAMDEHPVMGLASARQCMSVIPGSMVEIRCLRKSCKGR
jgi:hypothetical protein